jgi:hypothetical protein
MGKRGSYESIVEVNDPEATKHMSVIMDNAQWFEDNSPLLPEHKKKNVVGITYRFINTVGEAGDAAPSTPIGVNLPNADWIRAQHGSKSVSLGNISDAYDKSAGASSLGSLLPRCGGDRTGQEARIARPATCTPRCTKWWVMPAANWNPVWASPMPP